jgi:predicted Zn-dependent protease
MLDRKLAMASAVVLASGYFVLSQQPATADGGSRKETIHRALYDIYCKQDRLDLALQELRALIAINPSDASLHYKLGGQLMNGQQFKQAIPEMSRAAQLDPRVANYWGYLGRCYMRVANYTGALGAYGHAIQTERAGDMDWRAEYQTAQQYVQHAIMEKRYKEEQAKRKKEEQEGGNNDNDDN